MIKIAPSILSCDFSHLADEIIRTDMTTAEYIHIDVMDGMFVNNITIGPCIIKSIRKYSKKTFDVHLMINEPIRYIEDFANAGADIITVHHEACLDPLATLKAIKSKGLKAGISIKPYTSPSLLENCLDCCDMVLIMSVEPGFGGQGFIEHALDNCIEVRKMIREKGLHIPIEMDGGISEKNAKRVALAGCEILVAGSAVYKHEDISEAVERIRKCAEEN